MEFRPALRRKLLLAVVYIGLFLDYALLTSVEPILPAFFLEQDSKSSGIPVANTPNPALLADENSRLGILVGMKCLVQVFTQPFIGPLTTRIGFSVPLFIGFIIMIVSTILFAFGQSYGVLFAARAIQGIGSASVATAGMGMLAQQYSDDKERAHYMGIAMGGMALGLLVGPPYGGVMYDLLEAKKFVSCFWPALQFLVPNVGDSTSMRRLLMDPRVLIAAGSIVVANLGLGVLIPGLMLWMVEKWNTSATGLGFIFVPGCIAYLAGTTFLPTLTIKIGRWLCVLIVLPIIAVCLALMSVAPSIYVVVIPITIIGIGIGFVDSAMIPLLGQLAYQKHKEEEETLCETSPLIPGDLLDLDSPSETSLETGNYAANAYAISDAGLSIAYFVAPISSGPLVHAIGFPWMTWSFAIFICLFAPLALVLRKPITRERTRHDSALPNRR
ncbi:unnamed protein product, partial [Mesorhabditis spiculigera]